MMTYRFEPEELDTKQTEVVLAEDESKEEIALVGDPINKSDSNMIRDESAAEVEITVA